MSAKKIYVFVALCTLAALAATAEDSAGQDMTLQKVLAGYHQTIGADALERVEAIEVHGTLSFNGLDQPFKLYQARPGSYRLEIEGERGLSIQGFDGESAFTPARRGGVRRLDGAARALVVEEFGDFDGPLVGPQDNLELIGDAEFDGEAVWHLRITHGAERVENWFVLKNSFLPIHRTLIAEHRRAGPYERSWFLLEYGEFETPGGDTVRLPVYFEREDRQHVRAFTVEQVIFNPELPEGFFAPPADGTSE